MTLTEREALKKIHGIFFPHASERLKDVSAKKTRFVHYTSASTAMQIIRNREFWMREPSCMNDFMEVEHGIRCIRNAFLNAKGDLFRGALESISQGLVKEVDEVFLKPPIDPKKNNYIVCLSE